MEFDMLFPGVRNIPGYAILSCITNFCPCLLFINFWLLYMWLLACQAGCHFRNFTNLRKFFIHEGKGFAYFHYPVDFDCFP
jgi:hypothetical protein